MLYVECEKYKKTYHAAIEEYNAILDEQSKLFLRTQPGSMDYSKDSSKSSKKENAFDTYLIQKEKKDIDNRLKEQYKILQGRKLIYELKREELELSNDIYDKIYRYYYLDKLSIRKIEKRVYLSKSEIDRKLKIIAKNIN